MLYHARILGLCESKDVGRCNDDDDEDAGSNSEAWCLDEPAQDSIPGDELGSECSTDQPWLDQDESATVEEGS